MNKLTDIKAQIEKGLGSDEVAEYEQKLGTSDFPTVTRAGVPRSSILLHSVQKLPHNLKASVSHHFWRVSARTAPPAQIASGWRAEIGRGKHSRRRVAAPQRLSLAGRRRPPAVRGGHGAEGVAVWGARRPRRLRFPRRARCERPAAGPGSGAMKKDVRILLVGERECGRDCAGAGVGRGPPRWGRVAVRARCGALALRGSPRLGAPGPALCVRGVAASSRPGPERREAGGLCGAPRAQKFASELASPRAAAERERGWGVRPARGRVPPEPLRAGRTSLFRSRSLRIGSAAGADALRAAGRALRAGAGSRSPASAAAWGDLGCAPQLQRGSASRCAPETPVLRWYVGAQISGQAAGSTAPHWGKRYYGGCLLLACKALWSSSREKSTT